MQDNELYGSAILSSATVEPRLLEFRVGFRNVLDFRPFTFSCDRLVEALLGFFGCADLLLRISVMRRPLNVKNPLQYRAALAELWATFFLKSTWKHVY